MISILRLLRAAAGSDRDLLDRYVRNRDEEAFEALVRRYGTGVWTACVRLAGRDAEDAFQAVFLTLSRKAGTVTGALPAWLHAVTRRVASDLRRTSRRRAATEGAAARSEVSSPADSGLREGLALLDGELARLPERYRAVLIVCCIEGRSRDEAAAQLGWSEGQVKGRLERAREVLRARLARRGVELGGLLLAAAVVGPIPARADPPSAAVVTLTHGVIRNMLIQKLKLAAVLAACVGVAVAGGVVLRAQPGEPDGGAKELPSAPKELLANRAGAVGPRDKEKAPPKDQIDESAKKVKELQKERIATLKELADMTAGLFKTGRVSFEEVCEAQLLTLQAELDAAEKESDRIALYKKCVDTLKKYEDWAAAQRQAARGTGAAVLKITARRLEVEIRLEQAKMKEAQERK